MKKFLAVVICMAITLNLTGCFALKSFDAKNRTDLPADYSFKILQNIENTLKRGRAEDLCKLFGSYYNVTVDDAQALYDHIDGQIISADYDFIKNSSRTNEDGEYIYYAYSGDFVLSTSNGTSYHTYFAGYSIYDEEPQKKGLEYIYIENSADASLWYGIGNYQTFVDSREVTL